jgi:hypothetical protein
VAQADELKKREEEPVEEKVVDKIVNETDVQRL